MFTYPCQTPKAFVEGAFNKGSTTSSDPFLPTRLSGAGSQHAKDEALASWPLLNRSQAPQSRLHSGLG